jgi:hypothetical protein
VLKRVLFPESRAFIEINVLIVVTLAIRGFAQVYRPTIRAGKIRVTNVFGTEFWMPLWWRPFTMVSTVGLGIAALAYLALLLFYR